MDGSGHPFTAPGLGCTLPHASGSVEGYARSSEVLNTHTPEPPNGIGNSSHRPDTTIVSNPTPSRNQARPAGTRSFPRPLGRPDPDRPSWGNVAGRAGGYRGRASLHRRQRMMDGSPLGTVQCPRCGAWVEVYAVPENRDAVQLRWSMRDEAICEHRPLRTCPIIEAEIRRAFPDRQIPL